PRSSRRARSRRTACRTACSPRSRTSAPPGRPDPGRPPERGHPRTPRPAHGRGPPTEAHETMAANLKDIKSRIDSVKKTRQITQAMKLVAGAKLKRATDAATNAKPYQHQLAQVLARVAARAGE